MKLILAAVLALSLTACSKFTDEDVQVYLSRNGCNPTNEFVGKDADRLYLCADGIKYKYDTLRYGALMEKRNAK